MADEKRTNVKKDPRRRIGTLSGFACGLLLFLLFITVENTGFSELPLPMGIFLFFAVSLASGLVHVALHELGHLFFGVLCGYRLAAIQIGPFMLTLQKGGVRLVHFNVKGAAGQCVFVPPRGTGFSMLPMAGGAIFNLVAALLSAVFLIVLPVRPYWLMIFATVGLGLGALNLVPHEGVPNDGTTLKKCVRDPALKRSFQIVLTAYAALLNGIRPKDMDEDAFRLPEGADPAQYLHAYLLFLRYSLYLDRMDFPAATAVIEDLQAVRERLISAARFELDCERLFCLCAIDHDPQGAFELYERELCSLLPKWKTIDKKRVLTAYAWFVKHGREPALSYADQAEALKDVYPYRGVAESEMMLVGWLRAQIEAGA